MANTYRDCFSVFIKSYRMESTREDLIQAYDDPEIDLSQFEHHFSEEQAVTVRKLDAGKRKSMASLMSVFGQFGMRTHVPDQLDAYRLFSDGWEACLQHEIQQNLMSGLQGEADG